MPIFAAIAGAVVTVVVGHLTGGGGNPNDIILAIIKNPSLTFDQKAKLMELANESTSKFYTWLSSVGAIVTLTIGLLSPALAQRIRGS